MDPDTCGLAEFSTTDSLAVSVGGTGLTTQGICAFAQPGIMRLLVKVRILVFVQVKVKVKLMKIRMLDMVQGKM